MAILVLLLPSLAPAFIDLLLVHDLVRMPWANTYLTAISLLNFCKLANVHGFPHASIAFLLLQKQLATADKLHAIVRRPSLLEMRVTSISVSI